MMTMEEKVTKHQSTKISLKNKALVRAEPKDVREE